MNTKNGKVENPQKFSQSFLDKTAARLHWHFLKEYAAMAFNTKSWRQKQDFLEAVNGFCALHFELNDFENAKKWKILLKLFEKDFLFLK